MSSTPIIRNIQLTRYDFPFENEGELSKRRANIVDSKTLAEAGVRLNLIKKNYNLSYLIDKNYRKKSLGKKMLLIFEI